MEKGKNTGEGKMQVYEVGFHVVPSLSEDKVVSKAGDFRSLIEKNNGTVISEGAPKNQPLAYTLYKDVGSVRSKYNNAFFGWIKFEMPAASIAAIKDAMDKDNQVIRHIIIKTVRENTLHTPKVAGKSDEKKEEEVDKTIEKMVTE